MRVGASSSATSPPAAASALGFTFRVVVVVGSRGLGDFDGFGESLQSFDGRPLNRRADEEDAESLKYEDNR